MAAGRGQPLVGDKRDRQDLGWLASSTALPKKRRDIEGVSGTSIIELQAQLYRTQEHVRQRKEGVIDVSEKHVRRSAGLNVAELMNKKNAGVDERDHRDKLEVKTTATRQAECYAALERKAQLYDKLARGHAEQGDEKYEVDFLRKGYLGDEEVPSSSRRGDEAVDTMERAVRGSGAMMTADMQRERERRDWERTEQQRLNDESEQQASRAKHKEAILDLAEQTKEQRERAQAIKHMKEDAVKQKRDKLKESFLKKQLQKLSRAAT